MTSFLTALASALLVAAALAFINMKFQKTRKYPPGPRPWPIFGNLLHLGSLPHVTLDKWSKKYGEIMMVKFGSKNVVVASSPEIAKEFLKTQDTSFASRPFLASGKYTAYNYQDLTWAPYGSFWKLARKIYQNEIFCTKRLDSLEPIRVDESKKFFRKLFAECGNQIVIKEHLRRYTLLSITRVVLGDEFLSDFNDTPFLKHFDRLLDEWVVLNGVLNIGDWVPFLQRFDLQGYIKRMKILHKKLDKLYSDVIAYHKVKMEGENKLALKDMVDVLLMFNSEGANPKQKITEDGVKGLVHDLISGGTDTSATTVEWAIHELLRHSHCLRRLREELDRVIGPERWVQENDYLDMPYLEAVIKETLRLHPLVPMLVPHLALDDRSVAGYEVPKSTIVLINAWSIGKDPHIWEHPNDFIPERFLQEREISVIEHDFSLLPFGSGRRRCPGYGLALKLVRTTIGNIFHGFDLKLAEDFKVEDICMVERYGLTLCPKVPIGLILEPRLPQYLYQSA